jgi:hypothetical protein
MLRCKIVNLLLSLFPFSFWQDFLIRSHVQKCDGCMSRVASRDEVKALIFREDDVQDFQDLWPAVKAELITKEKEKKAGFSVNRRLAFAAAGIVAVCLAGFLFFNLLFRNGIPSEREGEARFQINSIRVGDKPATPFVYQPKDSDMILVWADKSM